MPSQKCEHLEFFIIFACDGSVAHFGKSVIKLHLAATKHRNFIRAAEKFIGKQRCPVLPTGLKIKADLIG